MAYFDLPENLLLVTTRRRIEEMRWEKKAA